MRAVVVGSTNVDHVLHLSHLPAPGETVLSRASRREAGGKGANQAAALARLGARTQLVSAVGDDEPGRFSLACLEADGVDVTMVAVTGAPTGSALVMLDEQGENAIVVTPGANGFVAPPEDVDADVLLLSLEVPLHVVTTAARLARARGVPVVLNAAPAHPLPAELLDVVDVLVVNETEWAALDHPSSGRVVVTLGAAGCRVHEDGDWSDVPAVPVEVVDTTGAGDCFAAAVAFGIGAGQSLTDAVPLAVRAAALSVTKVGARGGLPRLTDL